MQDLHTSRPTQTLAIESISGPHFHPRDLNSSMPTAATPVKTAPVVTVQAEDLFDSGAFNVEAINQMTRSRTESQVPSPLVHGSSSVSSPRMDSDPRVTRMKRVLDQAYGSTSGSLHYQRSVTHSHRSADIEFITNIAHMCGQGVDYQANLARWRAREELRIRNIRTLDILAARAQSMGNGQQADTRSVKPASLPDQVLVDYLHMRHILRNGGGRYLPRYPEAQRLAYDKTPTVYSQVNPPRNPIQNNPQANPQAHQSAHRHI